MQQVQLVPKVVDEESTACSFVFCFFFGDVALLRPWDTKHIKCVLHAASDF